MTTETLQLHHIANNLPYGLKFKSIASEPIIGTSETIQFVKSDFTNEINYVTIAISDLHKCESERDLPLNKLKPIMHPISSLTKPVRLKGYDEPVIPIVELAKIAFPEHKWTSEYGICFTDTGNEFDYNKGAFRYSNEEGYEVFVKDQWKLFAKLDEWMINYRGIPDNLVEYITDEFNPYV